MRILNMAKELFSVGRILPNHAMEIVSIIQMSRSGLKKEIEKC